MSITGVLIAALIVGGTGVFIGVFLGIAGKKFAVEVDEKEAAVREELPGKKKKRFSQNFRVTTVVDVDMPDVPVLQQLSQKEKLRSDSVRSAVLR